MAKVVSKARQLRLDYAAKLGRPVPLSEVARLTGIHRNVLSRIEDNQTSSIDYDNLVRLCQFYGVTIGDLLEIQQRTPDLIAA